MRVPFSRLALLVSVTMTIFPMAGQMLPDLPVVTNGISQGFPIGLATGLPADKTVGNWLQNPDSSGYTAMNYPGPPASYGVVFFTQGPAFGRDDIPKRQSRDVSQYAALVVELRGDPGATVNIGIKDVSDQDYGFEPKVQVRVSPDWQQYYLPLAWFIGVDLKHLYTLAEFVFLGQQPTNVFVRNVKYTAADYATTKILPHVAFGGGWYSAFYFTNESGAPVAFPIHFLNENGTPLNVPAAGGSSDVSGLTVSLGPRASSVVELQNSGALIQGYAKIDVPPDVVGYGLIRQSVQGQPDQQAIVPFSGATATSSTLIWNETDSVTVAAIANIDNVDAVVSIVVRDANGQTIGTSTVTLPANNKTAVILRNLNGLSSMAGQRGSADFIVSTGNIAVLGFRFVGAAFTAIPTADK